MFEKWSDEIEKKSSKATIPENPFLVEDSNDEGEQENPKENICARSHWVSFPSLFLFALLVLTVVLLPVMFKQKENKNSLPPNSSAAPIVFVAPTSTFQHTNDDAVLDLPDYSLAAIQSSPASPQARAYRWIKNDPLFENYSPARLLQRYALATLYYATHGDDWNSTTSLYYYVEGEDHDVLSTSTEHWMSYSVPECSWLSSANSAIIELCNEDDGGDTDNKYQVSTRGGVGIQLKRRRHNYRGRNYRGHNYRGRGKGVSYSRSSEGGKGGWSYSGSSKGGKGDWSYSRRSNGSKGKGGWIDGGVGRGQRRNGMMMMRRWGQQGRWGRRTLQNLGREDEEAVEDDNGAMSSWQPVRYLHLTGNNLIGELPAELALLTNVKSIDLSFNTIFGSIPTQIFSLYQLTNLKLSFNFISGTVPTEIGLWGNHEFNVFYRDSGKQTGTPQPMTLDLEANDLTMSLPSELSNLSTLQTLNLADNELTGSMFGSVGTLTALRTLLLQENLMTGTIPTSIGLLSSLERLEVSSNKLNGTLPTELATLQDLNWLILANNDIEGSIPTEFGALSNLPVAVLSSNRLSQRLPSELGLMTSLWQLWIYENAISGGIPSELGNLVEHGELELLTAYSNALTGILPQPLCSMEVLEFDCPVKAENRLLCGCDCTCGAGGNETKAVLTATESNTTVAATEP